MIIPIVRHPHVFESLVPIPCPNFGTLRKCDNQTISCKDLALHKASIETSCQKNDLLGNCAPQKFGLRQRFVMLLKTIAQITPMTTDPEIGESDGIWA